MKSSAVTQKNNFIKKKKKNHNNFTYINCKLKYNTKKIQLFIKKKN